MRNLLCGLVAAGLMLCTLTAVDAATVHRKKGSSKSGVKRNRSKSNAKGSADRTASSKSGKKGSSSKTSWRNRQLAPTPERYKEIQDALVAKGYLKPENATGGWNQDSVDALKRFQADQKIDSSGKINSLSLIALGLGPRRDTAVAQPATEPAQTDR
jgi:hypothetical protein